MKAFGDLTAEEQNKLFQAWLNDEDCIELYYRNEWHNQVEPEWRKTDIYRIKPVKPCPLCKATDIHSSNGKVQCFSCGLNLSRLTTLEAERDWNKRSPDNFEELKLATASLISRHKRFQIRWDEEDYDIIDNCVDLINK